MSDFPAINTNQRNTRRTLIIVMVTFSMPIIAAVLWHTLVPKRHFTDEQIQAWEKAAVDVDKSMQMHAILKTQDHLMFLVAIRQRGLSTEPLAVWRNLEPLLRKASPGPAEFHDMRKLATNLGVLNSMFDGAENPQLNKLSQQIIHWQNLEGHL